MRRRSRAARSALRRGRHGERRLLAGQILLRVRLGKLRATSFVSPGRMPTMPSTNPGMKRPSVNSAVSPAALPPSKGAPSIAAVVIDRYDVAEFGGAVDRNERRALFG